MKSLIYVIEERRRTKWRPIEQWGDVECLTSMKKAREALKFWQDEENNNTFRIAVYSRLDP